MRIGVPGTLRRTGRWLKSKIVSGATILLYHRVAELSSDPQLLSVKPRHFAQHLEILKKKYNPLSLKDLAFALREGTLPENPVVVTFDDGYADNLTHAKPLLGRYAIPATVFATAGYIGSGREFWWDDLERLLLHSSQLPETLHLDINGGSFDWELERRETYNADGYRGWNVKRSENPTARHALYRSLCQLLRPLPGESQRKILDTLLVWIGAERAGRSTHLPLTPEEITRLEEDGLVEVGAHTMTHALLSSLPKAKQQEEIQASKTALEEILGHPITTFAYPFGSRADYSADTVAVVREAGFELACANFPGTAWRRSDRFQLPRFLVRDWDGEVFERWLRGRF